MPFLAPLVPVIISAAAAAGTTAAVSAATSAGNKSAPPPTPVGSPGSNPNINNVVTSGQLDAAAGATEGQLTGQDRLQQALMRQGGIQNQSNVFNQEQNLANQLQAQTQGTGPNPAQAALAQNTAANVAQQGALMAGQRGASANPALIARLAAQQGASVQQGAVGQAATLQAQQQIAAQQQLQQQQAMQANLATTQTGQQIQNQQNLTGQQLGSQQALLQAATNQNQIHANIQNAVQQGQNSLNVQNQKMTGEAIAGGISGVGGALAQAATAPKAAAPASAPAPDMSDSAPPPPGYASGGKVIPPHLKRMAALYHDQAENQMKMAEGGDVGSALKSGGKVPGKAKVSGDSPKNDIVAAKLSPGEVVLPRSVMESKDPETAAIQFLRGLKKKSGKSSEEGDFKDALKRAIAGRKSK